MRASFDFSSLSRIKWDDYAVRFAFGGAVTVLAGLLAKYYGPTVGGLFLAFPAIFPSGATLVERHEREKKRNAGIRDTIRGRQAAALDASGAALGSIGLACFAVVLWRVLPVQNAAMVLLLATVVWLGVSILAWRLRKSHCWR
jgi:Protein of unknown function (DUF3147)